MFDKLEDLVRRFEEITNELTEPSVVNDQNRFRKLMKEQSDLQPLVDAYTEYRKCQETVEDSLAMLESESDDEMREMLKEEMSDAKKRIIELEQEMKILLLPKDPNDEKNVIVEIRAGRVQTLEDGDRRVRRDRYRRYEERDLYDQWSGCIFHDEI